MELPLTRGDCQWVPRPCAYRQCRYNNDAVVYNGSNCTLDHAEQGPMSERQIAKALGLSPKQVREALTVAQERMRAASKEIQ